MTIPLKSIALSRAETFQDLLDAEAAGLAEHSSIVFVPEAGRFAKYAWSGSAWTRVAGKFTGIDSNSGLSMSTGILVFAPNIVEINLGTHPYYSGHFDISGLSGLTIGDTALVWQVPGPYTGKSPIGDDAEWDSINPSGRATSTSNIHCYWTANGPVSGNFKFAFQI